MSPACLVRIKLKQPLVKESQVWDILKHCRTEVVMYARDKLNLQKVDISVAKMRSTLIFDTIIPFILAFMECRSPGFSYAEHGPEEYQKMMSFLKGDETNGGLCAGLIAIREMCRDLPWFPVGGKKVGGRGQDLLLPSRAPSTAPGSFRAF